ncbi:MAG: error-prone DNA polymerase, partial [candidate division Zixibacteria bacterium]|nr:error-prone DNA polymerase [candidate division Zixibacteria bacterium]
TAMRIYKQMSAFADFGFPESHAASFALLVYVSAYLKVYFPQEFYCSLLNAQPMGFYSPSSIIYEAKRRDVRFLDVDVSRSEWDCTIESDCIRLGFSQVKSLGGSAKEIIERELAKGCFTSIEDFVRRTDLNRGALEKLAMVGAFKCFGIERRQSLWKIMSIVKKMPDELPIEDRENGELLLNPMATYETLIADFKGMNLSTGPHPMKLLRQQLTKRGILSSKDLRTTRNNKSVTVAGMVIIRQRPVTAKGFLFITLEDETGFINIVMMPNMTKKYRRIVVNSSVLLVRGNVEHKDGVINVIGRDFLPLQFRSSEMRVKSRDFR